MFNEIIKERLVELQIDYSSIKIGDSNFYDDEWEKKEQKKVNLSLFDEMPLYKEQIRMYLLYVYRGLAYSTMVTKMDGATFLFNFLRERHPYCKSIEELNTIILNDYLMYMLDFKSSRTGKLLSATALLRRAHFIIDIFKYGQRNNFLNIDKELMFFYEKQRESIILNSPRIRGINKRKPTTKKEYKLETIKNIIRCAYEDEDMYLKTSLFVQTQCGLRIEEVFSIEENSIIGKKGEYRLRYTTTKTKKGSVEVEKPINDVAAELVLELTKFTECIRKELKTKKIFVTKRREGGRGRDLVARNYEQLNNKKFPVTKVGFMRKDNFNRDYIQPFVERWNIMENGELIHLTTHYFRHFFSHLAYLNDMSVNTIKDMLNHESFCMTATYMYNAENSMREKFKEMMRDPSKMAGKNVGNYQEKLTTKNIFKGKTEKQLDAIIGVMNVKILSNGACMHHPLKADKTLSQCEPNCLKCDKYVTHKCYLEVHKKRVRRLEVIMEDALNKGRKKWYDRNKEERDYIIEKFIKPFDSKYEEGNI